MFRLTNYDYFRGLKSDFDKSKIRFGVREAEREFLNIWQNLGFWIFFLPLWVAFGVVGDDDR